MADDWQKGDLAWCINAKPDRLDPKADCLVGGRIYPVAAVGIRQDGRFALAFREVLDDDDPSRGYAYLPYRFRKIRPHIPDAEDAETIRLLTGKPVREPAA